MSTFDIFYFSTATILAIVGIVIQQPVSRGNFKTGLCLLFAFVLIGSSDHALQPRDWVDIFTTCLCWCAVIGVFLMVTKFELPQYLNERKAKHRG